MKRFITLLVPLLAALLTMTSVAHAADVRNEWRNPGHHPLASDRPTVMNDTARRAEFTRAGLQGEALEKVMDATSRPGTMRNLVDGECFGAQLYQNNHVVHNLCVAFGSRQVDRTAERWRVLLSDGTVIEITLPYICHNISVTVIPPPPPRPPPPRTPCFHIPMNYQHTAGVVGETAASLQARGRWSTSDDQAYMNPDTRFAYVVVHMDLTDAETADLEHDVCFGYQDETGFHREVDYCLDFCAAGRYPSPGIIDALAEERGIRMPRTEPRGTFRIPLADAMGQLSIPVRYAGRFTIVCVEVVPYHLHLGRYYRWQSNAAFDLITPEQGARSVEYGTANRHANDDLVLLGDDHSVRYLTGALGY